MKKDKGKFLLAPWRWKFISEGVKREGCILCSIQELPDEEALILFRGDAFYVVLNRYPYSSGHLMIVPRKHLALPGELGKESGEFWELQNRTLAVLQRELRPDGFNLGMNLGAAAGAGVPGHFHLHVVPRWRGDANFMAVVGDTKVVSFDLQKIFEQLRRNF